MSVRNSLRDGTLIGETFCLNKIRSSSGKFSWPTITDLSQAQGRIQKLQGAEFEFQEIEFNEFMASNTLMN